MTKLFAMHKVSNDTKEWRYFHSTEAIMKISGYKKLQDGAFATSLKGLPAIQKDDGVLKWLDEINNNSKAKFQLSVNGSSSSGAWSGDTKLKNRDIGYDTLVVNASAILDYYLETKTIPIHLKTACLKVKTEIDDITRRNESGRLYASTNMPLNIVA